MGFIRPDVQESTDATDTDSDRTMLDTVTSCASQVISMPGTGRPCRRQHSSRSPSARTMTASNLCQDDEGNIFYFIIIVTMPSGDPTGEFVARSRRLQ